MPVIVFRRMYDSEGTSISWRLHGQSLPDGSIPIRFILDDKPKLSVFDILAVKDGPYRQNLDRASALGLLDDMIMGLIKRSPSFWGECTRFVAKHLPEAVPLAVKDLSKSKWHKGYLQMLGGLVQAGADINFILEDKTALGYAVEIRKAILCKRNSGNRDWPRKVIGTLQKAGTVRAS